MLNFIIGVLVGSTFGFILCGVLVTNKINTTADKVQQDLVDELEEKGERQL